MIKRALLLGACRFAAPGSHFAALRQAGSRLGPADSDPLRKIAPGGSLRHPPPLGSPAATTVLGLADDQYRRPAACFDGWCWPMASKGRSPRGLLGRA
jgi:hypothetical protein